MASDSTEPTASKIVAKLNLKPHPEGGFYSETFRDFSVILSTSHLPPTFKVDRPISTCIYFLVPSGSSSHLHRIPCSETWHFYMGEPLTILWLHHQTNQFVESMMKGNCGIYSEIQVHLQLNEALKCQMLAVDLAYRRGHRLVDRDRTKSSTIIKLQNMSCGPTWIVTLFLLSKFWKRLLLTCIKCDAFSEVTHLQSHNGELSRSPLTRVMDRKMTNLSSSDVWISLGVCVVYRPFLLRLSKSQ